LVFQRASFWLFAILPTEKTVFLTDEKGSSEDNLDGIQSRQIIPVRLEKLTIHRFRENLKPY